MSAERGPKPQTPEEIYAQLAQSEQAIADQFVQYIGERVQKYPIVAPILERAQEIARGLSGEIVLPKGEPPALPTEPMQLSQHTAPSPEPDYKDTLSVADPFRTVWGEFKGAERVVCDAIRHAGANGIGTDELNRKLLEAGYRSDCKGLIHSLRPKLRTMRLGFTLENSVPPGGGKKACYCFKDVSSEPPPMEPARLPLFPPRKPKGGKAVDLGAAQDSQLAKITDDRSAAARPGESVAILAQKVNRGQNAYACLEKMQKEIPWNDPMKTVVDALIERFQNTALIKQSPYATNGNIDENHSSVEALIDEIYQAQQALEEIVVRHMTLAKFIALKKYPLQRDAMGAAMDWEDLVSIGYEALIAPAARHDPAKGQFSKYVCRRIPGSMIDEIRHLSLVPRSVFKRVDEINDASDTFRQKKGRDPTVSEIGQQTGLSVEQVYEALGAFIQGAHVLSLSGTAHKGDADEGDSDDAGTLGDTIADTSEREPEREVVRQEELRWLDEAVHALAKREQVLLSLYYDRNLTMREIGLILGVSEARVWQLHWRAVERLRERAKHAQMEVLYG